MPANKTNFLNLHIGGGDCKFAWPIVRMDIMTIRIRLKNTGIFYVFCICTQPCLCSWCTEMTLTSLTVFPHRSSHLFLSSRSCCHSQRSAITLLMIACFYMLQQLFTRWKSCSSPALALCSQLNVCLLSVFPPPCSSHVSNDSSTFISILSLLSCPSPNTLIHCSVIVHVCTVTCICADGSVAITEYILNAHSPHTAGPHFYSVTACYLFTLR